MRGALLLAATLLLLAAIPPRAHGADRGLAGEFMCQCGCGLTLANCTHPSCGPRDQALAEIARLERSGQSRAQIREAFIQAYGEGVLAAPLRRGFNLLAYWGPYGAIAAGGVLIALLVAAWTRQAKPRRDDPGPELSAEQRALLEHALRALED
ncbi:MAG TPA: cytochrome c-type biogenesis protein CcmH [bacterium]|nr:cytochrome c-type biogenesis protein CcmH [bacterium]